MVISRQFSMVGPWVCQWYGRWSLGFWEIRCRLDKRIARVLFAVKGKQMVLLHGFIKKSQKTPQADLQLAKERKANLEK